jgi:hypothetical protein
MSYMCSHAYQGPGMCPACKTNQLYQQAPAPAAPLGAVEVLREKIGKVIHESQYFEGGLNDSKAIADQVCAVLSTILVPPTPQGHLADCDVILGVGPCDCGAAALLALPAPPAPQGIEWTGTKILDVGGHEVAFSACSGGAMAIEIISQRAAKFSQAYLGAEAIAELRKFLDLNYPATQEPAPQAAPSDLDSKPIFEALWTAARLGAEGKKEPYVIASDLMLALEFPEPAPAREPAALDIREAALEAILTCHTVRGIHDIARAALKHKNGSGETPSPTAPRSEIREVIQLAQEILSHAPSCELYFAGLGFDHSKPSAYQAEVAINCKGERSFQAPTLEDAIRLAHAWVFETANPSVTEGNRPNPSPSPSPVVPPVDAVYGLHAATVIECARLIRLWWKTWLKLQPNPSYYREVDRVVEYWPEKLMEMVTPQVPKEGPSHG